MGGCQSLKEGRFMSGCKPYDVGEVSNLHSSFC